MNEKFNKIIITTKNISMHLVYSSSWDLLNTDQFTIIKANIPVNIPKSAVDAPTDLLFENMQLNKFPPILN